MQTSHQKTACRIWLTAGLLLLSSFSHALGLGEPNLTSKLGEPLRMEIPLINTADLSVEQLIVGAANQRQYEKFKIGYLSIYRDLRYSIVEHDNHLFVAIKSHAPVKEPYLDILLTLKWPNGELVKSVTVLLDAP